MPEDSKAINILDTPNALLINSLLTQLTPAALDQLLDGLEPNDFIADRVESYQDIYVAKIQEGCIPAIAAEYARESAFADLHPDRD